MHLQSLLRRIPALGLVAALALVLALGSATMVSAQATPDVSTPVAGDQTGTGGDTGTGSNAALPNTGDGSTYTSQATPASGAGGETSLPSTGAGSTQNGVGGLWMVFAVAAGVLVVAVASRKLTRRAS